MPAGLTQNGHVIPDQAIWDHQSGLSSKLTANPEKIPHLGIWDSWEAVWDCANNRRTRLLSTYICTSFRQEACIFGLDPKIHKKDQGCEEMA
jgi:hypothetical protein